MTIERMAWRPLVVVVTLLACLMAQVAAESWQSILAPTETQCYKQTGLKKGQIIMNAFQVMEGGKKDMDFILYGPSGEVLEQAFAQNAKATDFVVEVPGDYQYCFSNNKSSKEEKLFLFNTQIGLGEEEKAEEKKFAKEHPLEAEVEELHRGLKSIKDGQLFLVNREKIHRASNASLLASVPLQDKCLTRPIAAESTNSRVMWWSIFESFTLIGVCLWQVYYMKRIFETKRTY